MEINFFFNYKVDKNSTTETCKLMTVKIRKNTGWEKKLESMFSHILLQTFTNRDSEKCRVSQNKMTTLVEEREEI